MPAAWARAGRPDPAARRAGRAGAGTPAPLGALLVQPWARDKGPFFPARPLGKGPGTREAALPGDGGLRPAASCALATKHQRMQSLFRGGGAVDLSTPVTVARVLSSKSRSARQSSALLAYLPLQGGLRPKAAAPGRTSLPRSLSSPVRRSHSFHPSSQRAPPGRVLSLPSLFSQIGFWPPRRLAGWRAPNRYRT